VPRESRAQANGLLRLSTTLTVRLSGPALGGLAIGLIGTDGAFLLDAGTSLVRPPLAVPALVRMPDELGQAKRRS